MTSTDCQKGTAHLLTEDHAQLDGLCGALLAALETGEAARAYALLDLFWARLAVHIRAENLRLFPAILNAVADSVEKHGDALPSIDEAHEAVAQLRRDHDFFMRELASAVKRMRDLQTEPQGGEAASRLYDVRHKVAAVSNRLEGHNELEEKFVYLWPAALLAPAEQTRLAQQVRQEIENLPPRFSNTGRGPVSATDESEAHD